MNFYRGQIDITKMLKYKQKIREVEFKDGIHRLLDVVLMFRSHGESIPEYNGRKIVGMMSCNTERGEDGKYDNGAILANFTPCRGKKEEEKK